MAEAAAALAGRGLRNRCLRLRGGEGSRRGWDLQPIDAFYRFCSTGTAFENINKPVIDRIIRVDHAGEYGANRIYAGQMAVLGRTSVGPVIRCRHSVLFDGAALVCCLAAESFSLVGVEAMESAFDKANQDLSGHKEAESWLQKRAMLMWDQEKEHLKKFNDLMVSYRVRPTILLPFWNVTGFVLGAGTALLGRRGAMACTVAVEESISHHYNNQIRTLMEEDPEKYKELLEIIKKFRDEELEHHDLGLEHDAELAPAYSVLKTAIQIGCRAAIFLSERI